MSNLSAHRRKSSYVKTILSRVENKVAYQWKHLKTTANVTIEKYGILTMVYYIYKRIAIIEMIRLKK